MTPIAPSSMPQRLTVPQFAEFIGVHERTAWRLVNTGAVKVFRPVPHRVYVLEQDARSFVERRTK